MKRLALVLLLVPMAVSVAVLLLVDKLDQPGRTAGGLHWGER